MLNFYILNIFIIWFANLMQKKLVAMAPTKYIGKNGVFTNGRATARNNVE
jgi:hypothetical protein